MSDLILAKKGVDPRVNKLALQIEAAQSPEITTMSGWLSSWGANPSPSASHHGGMGMGDGMMTRAEMDKLKQADGDKAGRLFLTGMISHHRGAIAMAKTETAGGENAAAKKLAASITTSQQAQIDTMQELLTDI